MMMRTLTRRNISTLTNTHTLVKTTTRYVPQNTQLVSNNNINSNTPIYKTSKRTIWEAIKAKLLPSKPSDIPDPYYGKYKPRTDPIPDGYWTQNPYGKPYYVGHTPQIEKLMKEAREMKLYTGKEHPWNPAREKDTLDALTMGIPGKYFGYVLCCTWFYLFWDIKGRSVYEWYKNQIWRFMYLSKLVRFWPTHFLPAPPQRHTLLPPVTDDDIANFRKKKVKEESPTDEVVDAVVGEAVAAVVTTTTTDSQ